MAARRNRLIHRACLALGAVLIVVAVALVVRDVRDPDGVRVSAGGGLVPALVAGLAGALLIVTGLWRPERGGVGRLGRTSNGVAVVLTAGLLCLWYLAGTEVHDRPSLGTPVADRVGVDAVVAPYLADVDAAAAPRPHEVPTGVFLQSIEFLPDGNVEVSGYVWQRYAAGIPADIARGFVLPEAVEDAATAEEAYREPTADGGEVIGWNMHAVLREQFDFARYPFDHQEVWLRLWHADLRRRAVLVPDFGAYPAMAPAELPGLGRDFVYQGWHPEFTTFSYVPRTYGSTFGLDGSTVLPGYPELYFMLGLRRASFNALFDHAFPEAVVALLLYTTLFLTTRDEERQRRYGAFTFEILRFCAALLFVTILAHNRLRGAISSGQIVYLEALPFLIYVALLLVALNALLVVLPNRPRLIAYGDNAAPRLLYWPVLLGAVIVISLVTLTT